MVQDLADRKGVGRRQLYTWIREILAGPVSTLVPVAVAPEVPRVEGSLREVVAGTPGVIEITLPSGVTVRVSGRVDVPALRGVLAELAGH